MLILVLLFLPRGLLLSAAEWLGRRGTAVPSGRGGAARGRSDVDGGPEIGDPRPG